MNFQPELAAKVMAGEKTVTRRLCVRNPKSPWFVDRCKLRIGADYAVCPGRGKPAIGRVWIVAVDKLHLGQGLTRAEAAAEGFESVRAFREAWAAINGSWSGGVLVWRIQFEVAS